MDDAPEFTKNKIVLKRIMSGLYKSLLFANCDQDFVHSIALRSKLKLLPEGTLVTAADVKSRWIYVILRGKCILQSRMAGDKERKHFTILKSGDACPVVEALNQVLVFVNVKTITAVELISIDLKNFEQSLTRFPDVRNEFSAVLNQHRDEYETVLLRRKGRLPEMTPPQRSLGQGDLFVYDYVTANKKINRRTQEFKTHFEALGKWFIFTNQKI